MELVPMRLLFAMLLVSASACDERDQPEVTYETGRPYYFHTFDGTYHPWIPRDKIEEEDFWPDDAYFVAYFDSDGRVIRLEKYLQGDREWTYEYDYDPSGKVVSGRFIDGKSNVARELILDTEGHLRVAP